MFLVFPAPQMRAARPSANTALGLRSSLAARPLRLSGFAGHVLRRRSQHSGAAMAPIRQQLPAPPGRRRVARSAVRVQALAAGWIAAGAAVGGLLVGLLLAKWAQTYFVNKVDSKQAAIENAQLRAKVEELQQIVAKYEPLAYKGLRLRFTKGVNKAVILGLVDELLSRKEVNIWWLPDSIERIFYFNVISLMLSVLDEIVEGVSMNFAGHNVKLQLTYLDMEQQQEGGPAGNGKPPADVSLLPAA